MREIQHLAARFPDVSNFQLAQIFWHSVHGYVRVYLIEKGLHPERTPLDKMVKYAARREEAYLEARWDERVFEGQVPGRTWGQFANHANGPEPYQPQHEQCDPRSHHDQGNRPTPGPGRQQTNQHRHGDHKKGAQSEKLSKEQCDKLHAEGRCFTCSKKGHESRNCSTCKTARAPNVSVNASSIWFANLEQLADQARRADGGVNVASIRIDACAFPEQQTHGSMEGTGSSQMCNEAIWLRAHTADCIEYLLTLLVSYFDSEAAREAGMEPEERFTIWTNNGELNDQEFLIMDHLAAEESPDEFIVSRTQMDDPNRGIPNMLQEAWDKYASLPPRAEWGLGFPSRRVSDKRHPALFWLRSKLMAALPQKYPFLYDMGYSVHVGPHAEGYSMSLTRQDDPLFIGHEEVHSPAFDVLSVLTAVVEDAGLEVIESRLARELQR